MEETKSLRLDVKDIIKEENLVYSKTPLMTDKVLSYCPGCGHGTVHRIIAEVIDELALEQGGYDKHIKVKKELAGRAATELRERFERDIKLNETLELARSVQGQSYEQIFDTANKIREIHAAVEKNL